jgi:hypothetical protein
MTIKHCTATVCTDKICWEACGLSHAGGPSTALQTHAPSQLKDLSVDAEKDGTEMNSKSLGWLGFLGFLGFLGMSQGWGFYGFFAFFTFFAWFGKQKPGSS